MENLLRKEAKDDQEEKKPVDMVVEYVVSISDYGKFISHESLRTLMGMDNYYDKTEYGNVIWKANRRLARAGKLLVNVRGEGYTIANPDDYPAVATKFIHKANRSLRHSRRILKHAPVDRMSAEARLATNKLYDAESRAIAGTMRPLEKTAKAESAINKNKKTFETKNYERFK